MNALLDDKKRAAVTETLTMGVATFTGATSFSIRTSWKNGKLTVGDYAMEFDGGYYFIIYKGGERLDTAETLTYMAEVVLRDLANGLIDRFVERLREKVDE